MKTRILARCATVLVAAFGLSACVLAVEERRHHHHHGEPFIEFDVEPLRDGTLGVEWTLEDQLDPWLCDDYYADALELAVYDSYDQLIDVQVTPCADFAMSVDLEDGWYSIDATLIDYEDRAVTTTLRIDDVEIVAGEELLIPIDFPIDSLL